MLIQLTTDRAVGYGELQLDGSILEINEAEGLRLLAAGQAIPAMATTEVPEQKGLHNKTEKRKRTNVAK